MQRGVQAEEVGEEAVEAVEQAAQEAGKDPSRLAALGQPGQALTSGILSLNDTTKLGIEVCATLRCTAPALHAYTPIFAAIVPERP